MRCVRCGKEASIYVRRHRARFCQECFKIYFERQIKRAIEEFDMFSKDERVLLAVSGGKDSISLWNALLKMGYDVTALHINLGIGDYSRSSLKAVKNFASRNGGKLMIYSLEKEHGTTLPELAGKHRNRLPCSVCGIIKRYVVNRVALEQNYTCVATGHTLDDCCAFLLNSTLSWDVEQMRRQDVKLESGDGLVKKVKPLCRVSDEECRLYAEINTLPYTNARCPFSRDAIQHTMKSFFEGLERRNPAIKQQFYFGFLRRMKPLIAEKKESAMVRCKKCGMPTIEGREMCAFCSIMKA